MMTFILAFLRGDRLSGHVARWVDHWNRTNTDRQLRSYPASTLLLNWATEHPIRFLLLQFVAAVVICLLIRLVLNRIYGVSLVAVSNRPDLSLARIETVWTIQATITALVYPIVLAFVTLLLQHRPSAKVSLQVYLIDTAAMPAAMSSVGLVISVGIGYVVVVLFGVEWLEPVWIVTLIWFLGDALLTTSFLFRTLRYLNDDYRLRAFECYAVQIALPRELRDYLHVHIFHRGQDSGLIPGQSGFLAYVSGNTAEPKPGPKIDLLSIGDGEPCVPLDLRRPRQVRDVRLRLLRWGLQLWLREARLHWEKAAMGRKVPEPVLRFQTRPGELLVGRRMLCRVANGPAPALLSRRLLTAAFVLGAPPAAGGAYPTTELLRELLADLLAATLTGGNDAIRERLLAVTHVHAALLDAGRYRDDSGAKANAAVVVAPGVLGAPSLSLAWVSEYHPWLEEAVGRIGEDTHAFVHATYLSRRLIYGLDPEPLRVSVELLGIHRALFFFLGRWWAKRVDGQGDVDHDPSREAILSHPYRGLYQRALEGAIGSWEGASLRTMPASTRSRQDIWQRASLDARFVRRHLQETAQLLVEAIARGDMQASRAFIESFVTWPSRRAHRYQRHLAWHVDLSRFITATALDESWDALGIDIQEAERRGIPPADLAQWICDEVLLRFWSDLRHVLILLMLSWTEEGTSTEPSLQAALLLLQGEAEQLGVITSHGDYTKTTHVVNRVVRQHFVRAAYTRRLDDFCEGAAGQRIPGPRPGRFVVRVGCQNLSALDDELLLLFYALAPDETFPSATLDPLRMALDGAFDEQQRGPAELLGRTLAQAMTRAGEASARTLYRH